MRRRTELRCAVASLRQPIQMGACQRLQRQDCGSFYQYRHRSREPNRV